MKMDHFTGKQNFEKNPEALIWIKNFDFEFLLDFGRKTPEFSFPSHEKF